MREIKFRAYYKADKRIYEVLYLDFASNELGLWDEETEIDFECSFEDVELMQYTGEKDKNGVEIYEGDIVSVKYIYDKRTTDRAQVVWREDKAGFGLKSLKGLTNEVYELYKITAGHNLEVVGNIYENPELLQ